MDLAKKFEELGTAFEEFKKTNDKRLDEMKANGAAKPETEAKLLKIEEHIAKLEKATTELNAAYARTQAGGGADQPTEDQKNTAQYKAEFAKYIRKGGDPTEFAVKAMKAMSVDSEIDGGFLVTPEISGEIVKKVFESSPIRQLASVQSIGSASLKINEDLDEAASGWTGERGTRSETNTPTLNQIEIFAHELYAFPKATQSFLDDAAVNVDAWLGEKVSDKFSRDEATAFMSGIGVNKPKGILAYGTGTSFGLIERVVTAANNALVAEDLIDTQTALKEFYQANASWMINRVLIGTIRKIKDVTSGQYIWQPGLQDGVPNRLLGRPVYMASDLPSTITATTDTIIYGDFKKGYQIVDRFGIRVLRDPFTAKPYVGFYTTKRVGGGMKNFEAIKILKIKT